MSSGVILEAGMDSIKQVEEALILILGFLHYYLDPLSITKQRPEPLNFDHSVIPLTYSRTYPEPSTATMDSSGNNNTSQNQQNPGLMGAHAQYIKGLGEV